MATDPNPELRAELEAALAVLEPQIRGLTDLVSTSISPELKVSIQDELVVRERRRDLIEAALSELDGVVAALDRLEADGYPELPPAQLPQDQAVELKGQVGDVEAGAHVFVPAPAAAIAVNLGTPAPKEEGI